MTVTDDPSHARWLEEQDAAESDRLGYIEAPPAALPDAAAPIVWCWAPKGGSGATALAATMAVRAATAPFSDADYPDVVAVDCCDGDLFKVLASPTSYSTDTERSPLFSDPRCVGRVEGLRFSSAHNSDLTGLVDHRAHAAAAALYDAAPRMHPYAGGAAMGLRCIDLSQAPANSPAHPSHEAFPHLLEALARIAAAVVIDAGRDMLHAGAALAAQTPSDSFGCAAVMRSCYLAVSKARTYPPSMFRDTYIIEEPRRELRTKDIAAALFGPDLQPLAVRPEPGADSDIADDYDRAHTQRLGARGGPTVHRLDYDHRVARLMDSGTLVQRLPASATHWDVPRHMAAGLDALEASLVFTGDTPEL